MGEHNHVFFPFFFPPFCRLIPSCTLETEPEVDFGTVIASSKIISKEISITNHGSLPGKCLGCVKLWKYFFSENVILCEFWVIHLMSIVASWVGFMWQGFGSGKNSLGGCYERSLAVPPHVRSGRLGMLHPVGSLCGVSMGRTASCGRDVTWRRGREWL